MEKSGPILATTKRGGRGEFMSYWSQDCSSISIALLAEQYMARYVCGVGGYLYLNVLLELYASRLILHPRYGLIYSAELHPTNHLLNR